MSEKFTNRFSFWIYILMFFTKRFFTITGNIAGRLQPHQYEEYVFVGRGSCYCDRHNS